MNQTLTLHLCLMTTTLLSTFKAIAQKGGSVALVTATHQSMADKIANHLKIFDEVHGSHDDNNLKGLAKANFLAKRFGKEISVIWAILLQIYPYGKCQVKW